MTLTRSYQYVVLNESKVDEKTVLRATRENRNRYVRSGLGNVITVF